jgi:hypothetical protein
MFVASLLLVAAGLPVPQTADAPLRLGSGEHIYEWVPDWPKLPPGEHLGITHGGIVIDARGRIFASTDGERAMLVIEPDGTIVDTWGAELGAGVHSMTLVKEEKRELLLLAYLRHEVIAATLDGEIVWRLGTPAGAGIYDLEQKQPGYHPTGIAPAPGGGLFVADGYGKSYVHRFDASRAYVESFGGPGAELGQMRCPHGLLLDESGEEPRLIVADRENGRLQVFDLAGKGLSEHGEHVRRPCALAASNGDLVVADLTGRVTILDRDFKLIAHLGENPEPSLRGNFDAPPDVWRDGVFLAPHSATWDADGNLYVAEWNRLGRIVKLRRVRE